MGKVISLELTLEEARLLLAVIDTVDAGIVARQRRQEERLDEIERWLSTLADCEEDK